MKYYIKIIIVLIISTNFVFASNYFYILNDECINNLYSKAQLYFSNGEVSIIKDSRGIILRLEIKDPVYEYYNKNEIIYKKIGYFLAKIENPVIIEVHTTNFPLGLPKNIRNWEFSTMLANDIENIIRDHLGDLKEKRIISVGYGEFLPAKNTSNNGGKKINRVDIIILCNVIGE